MITKQQQIDRLTKELIEHKGRICVGVDVDDTIIPYKIATKKDCDEVIDRLLFAQKHGALIIAHTACDKSRHKEITEYLTNYNLKLDGYNETIIDVPWGKPGSKIYANLFIDDRGSIIETLDILEKSIYGYIGYLRTNNIEL